MLKDELLSAVQTEWCRPRGPTNSPPPIRIALDGLQQSLEPVQFDASTANGHHSALPSTICCESCGSHDRGACCPNCSRGEAAIFGQAVRWTFSISLIEGELHLAMGPSAATASAFSRRRCCRISRRVHRKGPRARRRNYQPRSWPRSPALNLVGSIRHRSRRERPGRSKAWPQRPAMRAPISVLQRRFWRRSDLVSVLPLNVAKNMTRSHSLVFRRLSRSPQADRSCDDLAAPP